MLTRTEYLKLCLVLPFIGAALSMALALSSAVIPLPDWLGSAATAGWMAIFMFGIPYAVLASAAALFLLRRSWVTHVCVALLSPFLMLVTIAVLFTFWSDHDFTGTVRTVGPACLSIGYFYVGVSFLSWYVLSRCGWVVPERPSNERLRRTQAAASAG